MQISNPLIEAVEYSDVPRTVMQLLAHVLDDGGVELALGLQVIAVSA